MQIADAVHQLGSIAIAQCQQGYNSIAAIQVFTHQSKIVFDSPIQHRLPDAGTGEIRTRFGHYRFGKKADTLCNVPACVGRLSGREKHGVRQRVPITATRNKRAYNCITWLYNCITWLYNARRLTFSPF
ncbi:hypothetical protein CA13_61520 [Planctomycetes bacterium CA13]|uniref:Uncharacterized protein n=1 Tax=Novipirellula herctigrandis TaxID=2527986 RepID=A0A5C5ZBJ8_9BACT|nr:hypothetical protein CA13_61520 [Planctomycetes bacterium CA13]